MSFSSESLICKNKIQLFYRKEMKCWNPLAVKEHISVLAVVKSRPVHTGNKVQTQMWKERPFKGSRARFQRQTEQVQPQGQTDLHAHTTCNEENHGLTRRHHDMWQSREQSPRRGERQAEDEQEKTWRQGISDKREQSRKYSQSLSHRNICWQQFYEDHTFPTVNQRNRFWIWNINLNFDPSLSFHGCWKVSQ